MGIEPTSYVPVKRYLMEIAYDGGSYSGWQIQPHCVAVQQIIQEHQHLVNTGTHTADDIGNIGRNGIGSPGFQFG